MALGFGSSRSTTTNNNQNSNSSTSPDSPSSKRAPEKSEMDAAARAKAKLAAGESAFEDDDIAESQAARGRVGARIGGPVAKPINGDQQPPDSDTSSTISVGKQIELESDNAIKYRTCSWPKVQKKTESI